MENDVLVYTACGNELTDTEKVELKKFDYVRFTVCDLNGIGRCKAVPRRQIRSALSRGGVDIYAGILSFGPRSAITPMDEVNEINNGNALMVPMAGTIRPLPWVTEGKFSVCEVLCETSWIKPFRGGTAQAACPRFLARKQIERLDKMGYKILSGFEPEFMAFHKGTKDPIRRGCDIFSCRDFAEFEDYVYFVDSCLQSGGAHCGTLNTEYAAGQFEFPTEPSFGINSADMMFRLKQIIKEVSLKKDVEVTFMTQPIIKDFNNGLHFSHSLWKKDGNVNSFHKPAESDKTEKHESYMSDVLIRWLGGLVKHAPALTALYCPTVNCYRRLGTPFAPGRIDWNLNDRFKAFRVKVGTDQNETYIENRIPSGAANSYIILAATIAAGISGVLDPDSKPNPAGDEGEPLPKSLAEALDALEKDKVIVEALGEEFIRWFCSSKRAMEVEPLKDGDFDKELEMYFKML